MLPEASKSELVKVYDTKGVLIIERALEKGELNIQSLQPGVYVVKVGSVSPERLIVTQ